MPQCTFRGKIIKAGTATADSPGHSSAATAYVLDMTQPSPAWQATASMSYPRSYLNLTVLPDGEVLATGGSTVTDLANFSAAVYPAELWSPATQTWITMSSAQIPRLYHSTALLLPDARVLVAGGGREGVTHGLVPPVPSPNSADEPNAEIFSPPYLFKGTRPVISSVPPVIQYGAGFPVSTPDADRISSVALIALGAVTHAFNQNQRFVPLTFSQASGSLTIQAPVSGNIAPPGSYMLFIVDSNGIPSVASIVQLPAPGQDTQPPSAPANLSASFSTGTVRLSWLTSVDNVAVTGYSIYRSTTEGFVPSAATKIGQASAPTYTDTTFSAPGTYYYLVTAQDAAGNISSPSNEASAVIVPDTTPPTVWIVSPVAGATVTGVVALTATASDDVTVAGVQFLLDGASLGAEATGVGPNYSISWATTTTSNGPHTLSARARDGAGNTALAPAISVNISNTAPSGLVAAYAFSEGSGTAINDLSGNNITGTIVGATWTTAGRYGNALSFNGSTSYVDLGNPIALQLTGSMTLEAWINAAANPADDGQIIAKSSGYGWQFKTSPDVTPHTFGLEVSKTSSTSTQRYSATTRSLNTWYHVAGVYNATAGTLDIYVNGILNDGSLVGTIPVSQFDQAVNVNIGRRTGGYYFNGIIDEVRIYGRALSQAEIQTDMNTPLDGTVLPPDMTPPSTPANLTASAASASQINLSWTASSDNIGVTGYNIFRGGSQVRTITGTSYADTGLTASTTYSYTVSAFDAAGNQSGQSNVASATTTAATGGRAATPTFSPPAGTYGAPQSVVLSDASPGVNVYYTTDGTTPTTASFLYTGPISVTATSTIKAIAAGPGWTASAVATVAYTLRAATPTFSPATGTYSAPQSVVLSDTSPGVTIYYTTNGTTPTTASTPYQGPISVPATSTIKAIASATGWTASATATATYTLRAATPTFSLAAGTYTGAQAISLFDASPSVNIYYTTNGATPNTASTLYRGPISVTATTTIKAIATASGWTDSAVATAKYTVK